MVRFGRVCGLSLVAFAASLLLAGGCASVMSAIDDARVQARICFSCSLEIFIFLPFGILPKSVEHCRALLYHKFPPPYATRAKDARLVEMTLPEGLRLETGDTPCEVNGFSFYASYAKKAHPGFLTFYGDGKRALTDEMCFYPRSSGTVCAGSLNGVIVTRRWRAVGHPVPPKFPEADQTVPAAQGLLVTVYLDAVEIARLDFLPKVAEPVAAPWRVERNAAPTASASEKTAPQFPADVR